MLKKLCLFIISLNFNVYTREPDIFIERLWEKQYLRVSREIEIIIADLEKFGGEPNFQRLFMRKNNKVIWDKTFSDDFNILWNSAYFIPLIPEQFILDINFDGNPDFAIATSHGGQAVWKNLAVIFTIIDNEIKFLKTFPINIEFSKSVFKKVSDYNNEKYHCEVCH
jgi:hypothetical protein